MKKYAVTSAHYQGELLFTFDFDNRLSGFEIQAHLTEEQRTYFFKTLPHTVETLLAWLRKSPTMKIIEVQQDLTFDTFYKAYNYPYGDKKKARSLWDKLDDVAKTKCWLTLPRYNKYLETSGVAKIYMERFISKEYYTNDYK